MSIRGGIGWQTLLADLSLILFMVTAAAMAEPSVPAGKAQAAPPPPPPPPPSPKPGPDLVDPTRAQPLAIWREAPGGPGIDAWLASQQPDSRQRLTITLRYPPEGQSHAIVNIARLTQEAGAMGQKARIIMEPEAAGAPSEVLASLAYDLGGQQ
ncbi:hypothetical protein [Novosphingobium rosa]|uniref:hypothetical protein n=1 Tax=Novosphingobium rosa TaxID=76978 RepID=UPI00083299EA|nr:hypothetical protein [Novosphingobium rosa]